MPLPPPRLLLGGGCCDMLLLLLGAGLVRAAAELGSEAEPRLACCIRQRLHAAVVPEAAAVKADLHARHTQSCQLAQHTSGVAERWCARTRAGLPAGRLLAARPRSLPPARARARPRPTFSMFFCLHSSAILAPTSLAASTLAPAPLSCCRISGLSVEVAASVLPALSSITCSSDSLQPAGCNSRAPAASNAAGRARGLLPVPGKRRGR